jgi:hypothetical protein
MPEQRLGSGLAHLHSAALLVRHRVRIPIITHTGTTTRHLPIMPRRQLIIRRREAVGTLITGATTHASAGLSNSIGRNPDCEAGVSRHWAVATKTL